MHKRLPNPYVTCPSPRVSAGPDVTLPEESRNRPGSKLAASSPYVAGSWWHCQRLGMHVVPFGMNIPSYQSSSVVLCGMENGSGGRHRRTSLTIARIYGRLAKSENVGTRDRPTTESSSAWARL